MNIGVIRETDPLDHRVALTPPVVRHLAQAGSTIWVESGAGKKAMFGDDEYIRAGAQVGYSAAEVIRRSQVVVKISAPSPEQVALCETGTAFVAFFHLAVAARRLVETLLDTGVTAIGCEIVETAGGRRPVLAAASEIAGQMTISIASQLLRSSSGGRGILLGGSPGVPPAAVVILGAGAVGATAARTAYATGARVTVLDIDPDKLRRLIEHLPHVATRFAEPESIAESVCAADVVIGAVALPGRKSPHVVTREMVEKMRPGSVILDIAIDQGGCVETSRPTTIRESFFLHHGVVHYCVPNLTADMGRSVSAALAQALMPYLARLSAAGADAALRSCPELARGVYTYRGAWVHPAPAGPSNLPRASLATLLEQAGAGASPSGD